MERKVTITTTIEPSILAIIEKRAKQQGVTLSSFLRDVLKNSVNGKESNISDGTPIVQKKRAKQVTAGAADAVVNLSALPKSFTTKNIVQLYVSAGKTRRGAERWLASFLKAGKIERIGKGLYTQK